MRANSKDWLAQLVNGRNKQQVQLAIIIATENDICQIERALWPHHADRSFLENTSV
jgi:hypothetical protein